MGIYKDARRGKWVARGAIENGKREHLGSFSNQVEAQFAYDYHESRKKHVIAFTGEIVTSPIHYEQTGVAPRFSARMSKHLKKWAIDRLQVFRTDGTRRDR